MLPHVLPVDNTHKPSDHKSNNRFIKDLIDTKLRSQRDTVEPITAATFLEVWKRYDQDASRFMEPHEIRRFLGDLVSCRMFGNNHNRTNAKTLSESEQITLYQDFMDEFDRDKDGRISIKEMSAVLPVEECFLALFQQENSIGHEVNYMKVWKQYDHDLSGYIETDELKLFLRDLLLQANPTRVLDTKKLGEYAKIMMTLFDADNDGKLGLWEMLRLLPEQQNFVQIAIQKAQKLRRLTQTDINTVLDRYDRDNSGTLEGTEILNLIVDLLEINQGPGKYSANDVYEIQKALMKGCDVNSDGKIERKELAVLLIAIVNAGLSGLYTNTENFRRIVMDANCSTNMKEYYYGA